MPDVTDTVSDLCLRLAAVELAHRHAAQPSRCPDGALPLPESTDAHGDHGDPGTAGASCATRVAPVPPAPLPPGSGAVSEMSGPGGSGVAGAKVSVPPVMLVRYRTGVTGQTARTVHLVSMPDKRMAGVVATLCGALLDLDEIETGCGQGMPCTMCLLHQVSATTAAGQAPVSSPEATGAELSGAVGYQAWGWPVTQHHHQLRLSLRGDVSAIAIPIPLSTEVTQLLNTRYCAPAVLAHPYAPDHHIVLTGQRYAVGLPWPPSVHHVTGALLLPPTITPRGPITWTQPPCQDSLRLSREIDVFGALRTVLSNTAPGEDPPPANTGPLQSWFAGHAG